MSKKTIPHPYAERQAFERLMLLIATLVQHPGVGCPPVLTFIEEGKRRHPSQKIKVYKDGTTAKPKYLDYTVKLPPRSLNEFSLWVFRYMDNAQVLSPPHLVEKHSSAAQALVSRYGD